MKENDAYQTMKDLSSLLLEEEQYEEAGEILKKMVILKPDDPFAWFDLGISCSRMNWIAEAGTAYKRSYELRRDPHTLMALITALKALGRAEEAKTYLEEYRKEYSEAFRKVSADIADTLCRCRTASR